MSETPQLLVDQWHQSGERILVALPPTMQKLVDLTGLILGHDDTPVAICPGSRQAYSISRRSSIRFDFFGCNLTSPVRIIFFSDEAFRSLFPPSGMSA